MSTWPLVVPNDDGLRPAGKPDECFYCRQKIGSPHGPECTVVTKKVRLAYTIEVEVRVPHHWTVEDIEFHRNESSWCSNNALDEIEEPEPGCMCHRFSAKFIRVVDETPHREIKK